MKWRNEDNAWIKCDYEIELSLKHRRFVKISFDFLYDISNEVTVNRRIQFSLQTPYVAQKIIRLSRIYSLVALIISIHIVCGPFDENIAFFQTTVEGVFGAIRAPDHRDTGILNCDKA